MLGRSHFTMRLLAPMLVGIFFMTGWEIISRVLLATHYLDSATLGGGHIRKYLKGKELR